MKFVLRLWIAVPLAIPFATSKVVDEMRPLSWSGRRAPISRKRTTSLRYCALFPSWPPIAAPGQSAVKPSLIPLDRIYCSHQLWNWGESVPFALPRFRRHPPITHISTERTRLGGAP
jgi:hypothetical protein